MTLLLAATWWGVTLQIFFLLISFLLIFMVVITPSNEGGMAAAFGGMGGDTFFGSKANQHINKFTVFLAVSFLVLAFGINLANTSGRTGDVKMSPLEQQMKEMAPPAPKPGELPPLPEGSSPKR